MGVGREEEVGMERRVRRGEGVCIIGVRRREEVEIGAGVWR